MDHVSWIMDHGSCIRSSGCVRSLAVCAPHTTFAWNEQYRPSDDIQISDCCKSYVRSPCMELIFDAAERNRYDGFLKRSKRTGFCPTNLEMFSSLCERADDAFFFAIKNNNNTRHVLHHLLQDKPSSGYSLRERVHNFVLPNNNNSLSDHNFLNRILYKKVF